MTRSLFLSPLLLVLVPGAGQAQGTVSVPAQRFVGVIRAGGVPLKWGPIRVITGLAPEKVCAEAFPDDRGRFTLNIPARAPDCVRSGPQDDPITFLFVLGGESLGSIQENTVSLARPELLGPTRRHDLVWNPIPGFEPQGNSELVAVRFWGRLFLGNSPAPAGTRIDVLLGGSQTTGPGGAGFQSCGQGETRDERGSYWIDVALSSPCVRELPTSPPISYIFMVNGERLAVRNENIANRAQFTTLGQSHRQDLKTTLP